MPETWMGIYQKSVKIGMPHRKIAPSAEGIALSETTVMRLNTMGMFQDIHLKTKGVLNPDFSLSSFQTEIISGLFHFTVSGKVQGSTFVIDANVRPFTLSLQAPVYLSAALWDAAERVNHLRKRYANCPDSENHRMDFSEYRKTSRSFGVQCPGDP